MRQRPVRSGGSCGSGRTDRTMWVVRSDEDGDGRTKMGTNPDSGTHGRAACMGGWHAWEEDGMHGRRVARMGGGWCTWEEVGYVGGGWVYHCRCHLSLACHHHCRHLCTTTATVYALPLLHPTCHWLLPSICHCCHHRLHATGHCPLRATAATTIYVPPLPHSRCPCLPPFSATCLTPMPLLFRPHHCVPMHPPMTCPKPPPTRPILHGPICATRPPTNMSQGGYPCHTLDGDSM